MPLLNMVQAINLALRQEMQRDARVMLLGEDIGVNGGVFRVTDGLQNSSAPTASSIPRWQKTASSEPPSDWPSPACGRWPNSSSTGSWAPPTTSSPTRPPAAAPAPAALTCPLTVRVPIGGGIHAPELHSDSPEAVYAHAPGLKVVIPSHPYDAKGLLLSAIRDPDPVIFFEPKCVYRSFKEEVPDEDYTVPIGQAKVLSEGTDLTVITWGAMVFQCLEAIDRLPEEISVELIDLRTIYPPDTETIAQSVKKTGRAVVVHEAAKTAGMGTEISSLIQEHCFLYLQGAGAARAGFDTVMPFYKLEQQYLPDADRITAGIRDCLAY